MKKNKVANLFERGCTHQNSLASRGLNKSQKDFIPHSKALNKRPEVVETSRRFHVSKSHVESNLPECEFRGFIFITNCRQGDRGVQKQFSRAHFPRRWLIYRALLAPITTWDAVDTDNLSHAPSLHTAIVETRDGSFDRLCLCSIIEFLWEIRSCHFISYSVTFYTQLQNKLNQIYKSEFVRRKPVFFKY